MKKIYSFLIAISFFNIGCETTTSNKNVLSNIRPFDIDTCFLDSFEKTSINNDERILDSLTNKWTNNIDSNKYIQPNVYELLDTLSGKYLKLFCHLEQKENNQVSLGLGFTFSNIEVLGGNKKVVSLKTNKYVSTYVSDTINIDNINIANKIIQLFYDKKDEEIYTILGSSFGPLL